MSTIVEVLDDSGEVREEYDIQQDCPGGPDTCGGCFRCMQRQYPDMRWRYKGCKEGDEPPRAQIIDLFEALKRSLEGR